MSNKIELTEEELRITNTTIFSVRLIQETPVEEITVVNVPVKGKITPVVCAIVEKKLIPLFLGIDEDTTREIMSVKIES